LTQNENDFDWEHHLKGNNSLLKTLSPVLNFRGILRYYNSITELVERTLLHAEVPVIKVWTGLDDFRHLP